MDAPIKDAAAVALGKRRAASLTADHQAAAGRAAQAAVTPEERLRRAAKAAKTRKTNQLAKLRQSASR